MSLLVVVGLLYLFTEGVSSPAMYGVASSRTVQQGVLTWWHAIGCDLPTKNCASYCAKVHLN